VAKKANVKCKVCGKTFDRNAENAVKVGGNRYAHATCAEGYEVPQDEQDLDKLHKYLQQLFKNDYNYVVLQKQIETFVEVNKFSYTGILKSLIYWYEIKENTLEKSNDRIGIVPFIYQDALKYYLALFMANEINKDKRLEDYKTPIINEVKIKKPVRDLPVFRLFNLDD
jgi:hypothetical protein